MNQHISSVLIKNLILAIGVASVLTCCTDPSEKAFSLKEADETNITFTNSIEEDHKLNILSYEYMYNGGGIAAGDFNNDGLQDLFFTGNQTDNALYLNEGNWKFRDITHESGTQGRRAWKTGVTTADVNGDGKLDIYVCYSGPGSDAARKNELFINNGGTVPSFTESAKAYGLDAEGTFSTQAAFFDFDLDGDLDMFLLNHAKITYSPFYNTRKLRSKRHRQYGNRLYLNEGQAFKDISEAAGIHGSGINFGLGLSISDVNDDGWPDIYVTNDYEEQDYFYLNNHDGTFRECLKESFAHISRFGMGSDIADYNNDGLPDVIVVDMLPEDNFRQKLLKGPDEFDKYMLLRDSGYHHQNMRNMLQLNQGVVDGTPKFSEIGQLAGVSGTDWSWCPLFVDLDNDGWKDLFITNGYLRDFTNMDFLKYAFEDRKADLKKQNQPLDTAAIIKAMPSTKLTNYCFHNNRDFTFRNVSQTWGFDQQDIANGAVFVDLDNDGDQDLVTNRINENAGVFENNANKNHHYLKIRLSGPKGNSNAVGAKVKLKSGDLWQMQEAFPTRGFQSCMANELIFGLGTSASIDEIIVRWPDQKITTLKNISSDTTINIAYVPDPMVTTTTSSSGLIPILSRVSDEQLFNSKHTENNFIDYKTQFLLPYQLSSNGPCLTKGDVNNDGYDDLFVGGSPSSPGRLFISNRNLKYSEKVVDNGFEDTGATFVDVDGDHDLDLYVVSGGNEFSIEQSSWLQDRLYLNDGKGNFGSVGGLPREKSNGSFVIANDFDQDGDQDLFVGGRTLPGYYPLPANSYLLRNESKSGKIKFVDVTPGYLQRIGMITCGSWTDYNGDGWTDLVLAGEFTPVHLITNDHGKLKQTVNSEIGTSNGLWSTLISEDIDNDGDQDLIAGNAGKNIQFTASATEPLTLHYHDFNDDGKIDPVLSHFIAGKSCVYSSRDEILEQMPQLKRKFISYESYAGADLAGILTEEQLAKAKILKANTIATTLFINNGTGTFSPIELPVATQFSKVNGIIVRDFNHDGTKDILISGNFFPYRVQLGRNDAGHGLILTQQKDGSFTACSHRQTGFFADGDIRSMTELRGPNGQYIVCGVNNDFMKLFKVIDP